MRSIERGMPDVKMKLGFAEILSREYPHFHLSFFCFAWYSPPALNLNSIHSRALDLKPNIAWKGINR